MESSNTDESFIMDLRALVLEANKKSDFFKAQKNDKSLRQLYEFLFSENPTERKQSLYILQSLSMEVEDSEVKSTWTLFFDAFEALNEKQYHVIEPFLSKIQQRSKEFTSPEFLPSYFIILRKMIEHDNRQIVEKGLDAFITSLGKNSKNVIALEMLRRIVVRVLREFVSWIFPTAPQFFNMAKSFGKVIGTVWTDSTSISLFYEEFCKGGKNGLSSFAILFALRSFKSSLESATSVVLTNTEIGCLVMILEKSLESYDSYLRSLIENDTIEIFTHLCQNSYDLLNSEENNSGNFSWKTIDEKFLYNFFEILSRATICINCTKFPDMSKLSPIIDTPLTGTRAHGRILFVNYCKEIYLFPDRATTEKILIQILKFFEFDESLAVVIEFLKCVKHLLLSHEPIKTEDLNLIFNSILRYILSTYHHDQLLTVSILQMLDVIAQTHFICDVNLNEIIEFLSLRFIDFGKSQEISSDIGILSLIITLRRLIIHRNRSNQALDGTRPEESKSTQLPTPSQIFKVIFKQDKNSNSRKRDSMEKFYEMRMKILSEILRNWDNFDTSDFELTVESILECVSDMDNFGPAGIVSSIDFIVSALSHVQFQQNLSESENEKEKSCFKNFILHSWSHVLELRKTNFFWNALKSFIDIITHSKLGSFGILSEFAEKIFNKGETVIGVPLILLEKLVQLDYNHMEEIRRIEITNIATRATYFGTHLMKHNRIIFRIYDYESRNNGTGNQVLRFDPEFCSWDEPEFTVTADCKTRILGLLTLMDIQRCRCNGIDLRSITSAVDLLLDVNDNESIKYRRYFGNSPTHRLKQRISQVLLVLHQYFSQEIAEKVIVRLISSLLRDSPQQSVRYFMEWTVVKILNQFPHLHDKFFKICIQSIKERAGFGSYFSTIVLQVSKGFSIIEDQSIVVSFCTQALDILLNLFIGQHLPVRVYATICFRKIYDRILTVLSKKHVQGYAVVYKNVVEGSLTNSGLVYKTAKLLTDFWIEYFDPMEDFNAEGIFIDIPLLAGMSFDESIQRKDLLNLASRWSSKFSKLSLRLSHSPERGEVYSKLLIEFKKKSNNVLSYVPTTEREMGEEVVEEELGDVNNDLGGVRISKVPIGEILQRKPNPWKYLPITEEELSEFSESLQERKRKSEEGLIVVASLIDRIPNLGGLCRSCEIFGVSKYVISSLKLLNDQQFKSLSVSAHNWLEIMEVLPRDLGLFLSSYRVKGYRILGIEQTVGSVPLNHYNFPKKSILLLGHEKYGIPAEFLHLVDDCLEIPQVGLTRSLNVHVTGALCIWQYATQHLIT